MALSALAALPLLAPGARVVVEHSRRESLPEACGALAFWCVAMATPRWLFISWRPLMSPWLNHKP